MGEDLPRSGWRRREVIGAAAAGAAALRFPPAARAANPDLDPFAAQFPRLFADPPLRARPGCYWYWLGGAVTDEGITRDLEEMRKAGISTAMMFSIGKAGEHPLVSPPADALTPTWWARVAHAAAEAERLGVELAVNACDGWATAAGPWITPELSMQHVVWSERFVDGGAIDTMVERPPALLDYYRDIATFALPIRSGWEESSATLRRRVTTNLPINDLAKLADPANYEQVVDTDRAGWIEFAFPEPFTVRSVTVRTAKATSGYSPGVYRAANSLRVEASDDGVRFRPVGRLDYPQHGWQTDMTTLTHALPPTTAHVFRFLHVPEGPFGYEEERDFGQDTALKLSSLTLSSMPAIQSLPVKSGEQWGRARRMTALDCPDSNCTPLSAVIDVSDRIGPDGRMRWQAPPGRWRILRIGYTTTGKGNSAAGAGQGLECSRFESAAVNRQYENWFEKMRDRLGALGQRVVKTIHVDSWEAGTQNWSPTFAAKFRDRRGYDFRAWLPVMAGVPMESADFTERALYDVRRTIADLVSEVFYTTLSSRAEADRVRFTGEPPSPTFPVDGLDYARFLDMPMGEFWYNSPRNDKPTDIHDAVSGGRIYGKRVIGSESFTETLIDWTERPAKWKALGDHNWCLGINRFMLHVWAMQPFPDRGPGMTLNGIGTQFNYLQSWWKPGKSWFDYLGRAQALLQEGRPVADIAYFIGEDIPARSLLPRMLAPALPAGYAYDSINRDALLRLARVEGGWLVLPGGARYRLLVLPPAERMTPELMVKLAEFARAGLPMYGPRPLGSPSLAGGSAADTTVGQLGEQLWGSGRIADRGGLAPLLRELEPDLLIEGAGSIEWTHRQGPGWDLYFLSNQSADPVTFTARLRVSGRAPELWDAERGDISSLAQWGAERGMTRVPLHLKGAGSAFLMFSVPADDVPVVQSVQPAAGGVLLKRENRTLSLYSDRPGRWSVKTNNKVHEARISSVPAPLAVDGPWLVRFVDPHPNTKTVRLDQLVSWPELSDPDLRFYSGLATYSTMLELPALPQDSRLLLDLGDVRDLATVRLNGRRVASLFMPPFTLDVTDHLRTGRNALEIDVANTWRNRLIGDYGKPESGRVTEVHPLLRKGEPWLPGGRGAQLDPAGLLGPVKIRIVRTVQISA